MWSPARAARLLLQVHDSPSRVALAFGLGIFIAFFPILGIHTALALLLAVAFRLSKVAILVGAWTNNPWTIGPMYTAGTLVGCLLTGVSPATLGAIDWSLSGTPFYRSLLAGLGPLLVPYLVGNLVVGAGAGLLAFVILRQALTRRETKAEG